MRAVVFAAGRVEGYERLRPHIDRPELVLCADGGARHALALNLKPDLVLGDFDSAGPALFAELEAGSIPLRRVDAEKDQTDSHLALIEAVRRGATEILLIGATGGRLDHTLSNLLLLPGLPPSVSVTVLDGQGSLRLMRPQSALSVQANPGGYLSLVPLSPQVDGVHISGVKWPLNGATLRWGESLGVSNLITGPEVQIRIGGGYLLVIQAWD